MINEQDLASVPSVYRNSLREDMALYLPSEPKRVLEIGCGDGGFSTNLNEDVEYWGVEPEVNSCKIALERNRKGNILNGFYFDVENKIPNEYFDVIVCNDVIEHIPEHIDFLLSLKEKMTKDAIIIASIPNVRFLYNLYALLVRKDWEYKDSGVLDKTHYRFFTKKSIIRMFESTDFEIEEINGLNSCFSSSSRLIKALKLSLLLPVCLLGFDSQFMQFTLRAKLKGGSY